MKQGRTVSSDKNRCMGTKWNTTVSVDRYAKQKLPSPLSVYPFGDGSFSLGVIAGLRKRYARQSRSGKQRGDSCYDQRLD